MNYVDEKNSKSYSMGKLLKFVIPSLCFILVSPATRAVLPNCDSPIVIDLGRDGIHLGQAGVAVFFDLYASGSPIKLQWVSKNGNEAFLAMDSNQNGIIDDGSELFGNGTPLILENYKWAANGFVGLAQYDLPALGGNDDGKITAEDEIWGSLSLWLDANADGISTTDEMLSLASFGIASLETIPKENNRTDNAGNWLPLWGWSESTRIKGNNKYKMVDVFFKRLATD